MTRAVQASAAKGGGQGDLQTRKPDTEHPGLQHQTNRVNYRERFSARTLVSTSCCSVNWDTVKQTP